MNNFRNKISESIFYQPTYKTNKNKEPERQ